MDWTQSIANICGVGGLALSVVNSLVLLREGRPAIKVVPILVYDTGDNRLLTTLRPTADFHLRYIGVRVIRTSKALAVVSEVSFAKREKWPRRPTRLFVPRERVQVRNATALPARLSEQNETIECLFDTEFMSPSLYDDMVGFYVTLTSGQLYLKRAGFMKPLRKMLFPKPEPPSRETLDPEGTIAADTDAARR